MSPTKDQIINIFNSVIRTVSVATTHSAPRAESLGENNACGHVPIKLDFQKWATEVNTFP